MQFDQYVHIRQRIIDLGYSHEILWSEDIKPPTSSEEFALEYCWVVLNSGMRNQVAQTIWDRVRPVIEAGGSATSVFGHPGKSEAIDLVWREREKYFAEFKQATDVLEFCLSLPWIGKITRFHLAKSLGSDFAKPDRHLVRISEVSGESTAAMCKRLSDASGDRVATVDLVIWRAANLGVVKVQGGSLKIS